VGVPDDHDRRAVVGRADHGVFRMCENGTRSEAVEHVIVERHPGTSRKCRHDDSRGTDTIGSHNGVLADVEAWACEKVIHDSHSGKSSSVEMVRSSQGWVWVVRYVAGMRVELPTGQTLAIDRYGDTSAPSIVLLHGLSGSRLAYAAVVRHLTATRVEGGAAQVINVDMRGHGESTRADSYDAPSYAADIAALIEKLEVAPAVVVGHSLGGVVGMSLAVSRPELVRGLFLEDPPLFEGDAERRSASPAASFFPALIKAVKELQARKAPVEEFESFAEPGESRDEIESRARSLMLWDPATMEAAVSGVVWHGFDPLAAPSCPTTVLRADPNVGAVFQPDDARALSVAAPEVQIHEVVDSGHTIHATPTLAPYLAHLDEFLDAN
jgi:pimeloyl-ACP methyl ester carboxylesterase